jgi:zinc and cadmium transporter
MLAYAVGVLLAFAFTSLLPEAVALGLEPGMVGQVLLGGVAGYFALDGMQAAVPYVLVIAAASFIYIAVADLVPELHRQRRFSDAAMQLVLLLSGIGTVQLIGLLLPHTH